MASHPIVVSRKPGRRRRGGLRAPRAGGLDINPSRTGSVPGSVLTVVGEDRIHVGDFLKDKLSIHHFEVNASQSIRLANLAKAYQRIRWDMVQVIVTPQVSVTTNGGYVAGFVMDPDDRAVTARQLSSVQGSQTKKFYETCVLKMPPKRELLYTSGGTDARLSTPAIFWMITEGYPSVNVPVVFTMKWRVTLSEPTVEPAVDQSFVLEGKLLPKQDNYNLQYQPPVGSATDDCSAAFPLSIQNRKDDSYFRVPTFLIEYKEGTGDTGTVQAHFIVYRPTDKRCYYSASGEKIDQTAWQGDVNIQVVVPCGTFMKYEGSGNPCGGVSVTSPQSASPTSTDYTMLLDRYTLLLRNLEKFSLKSKNSSENDWTLLMKE